MFHVKLNNKILIISGPTASGKSALALDICNTIKGRIINADSIQLYKELPILSAQPNKVDISKNEHKLYSILNCNDQSSVNNWLELVNKEIKECFINNLTPIIVGGTGLYISKLVDGINEIPAITSDIKSYCRDLYENHGKKALISELIKFKESKEVVSTLDKQRLIRRLEIIKQTNKSLDYFKSLPNKIFYKKEQFIHINLNPDREILYKNCNSRFEKMINEGAIEEAVKFLSIKPNFNLPICKTIGLIEIKEFVENKIKKEDLLEIAAKKTRNYAKRQITWFKHQFSDKYEINHLSENTLNRILDYISRT